MNRDALWRILGLFGVPAKLIDLMSEPYSGIESVVRCGGTISDLLTSAIEDGRRLLFSPLSVCLLLTKSKGFISILMTSVLCLLLDEIYDFVKYVGRFSL